MTMHGYVTSAACAAAMAMLLAPAALADCGKGSCSTSKQQECTTTVASSCGGCTLSTTVAADQPTADELLAEFEAIRPPAWDQNRRDDQEYVREIMQKQREAMEKRAEVARQFVDLYPDHYRAPHMLMVVVRTAPFGSDEQTALFRQLAENYPDSAEGKQAKATLRQTDAIGEPFELEFTELRSGETISMEDLRGKVVVVDFWATWCGPCVAKMPEFKSLYEQYRERGVEFIGISLDQPEEAGGRDAVLKFIEENDIEWLQYYQGNGWQSEFSQSWGIQGIPTIFLIDAEGKLRNTRARANLSELIEELLAERDGDTPDARAAAGEGM